MSIANKLNNGDDGKKYGSMLHPWLKTQEFMIYHTPSRRDGITYEEEMSKRQQCGRFVFDVVMCLTHGKGENGQMGVAITLVNRFFNVHSFKIADFRDVAAACVFLAGKNEDTPKKLKYVVNQLWQIKYPHQKQFPSEAVFQDVCNVVTYLEEIVLKTVAFDINVDLPHQHVLKLMRDIEKGRNDYKEMVKTAYYMATDILLITDWSVRYSCHAMASACINIAAYFHKLDMDNIVPLPMYDTWYRLYDKDMKRKDLDSMTKEFLTLFADYPHLHIGSLKRIDPHGLVEIKGRIPPEVTSSTAGTPTLTSSASSSNLKKLDMESYKGRQKTQGPSESTPSTSTRPSFLPDVKNQKVVEEGLKEQKRQQELQRQMHQQRHHGMPSSSSSNRPSSSSSTGSSRSHHHNHQRPRYDDAQKRPMPRDDQNSGSKKPRIEDKHYISFVASSSSSTTTTSKDKNGCISSQTTTTKDVMMTQLAPPPVPPPVPLMSVPVEDPNMSSYAKMLLNYQRNSTAAVAVDNNRIQSTHHHAISSTEQISPPDESSPTSSSSSSSSNNNNNAVISSATMLLPPPPPPPVLPPLRLVEEIEDGELV
ncbi:CBN-CIT-1.2 protein [Caenorhabditis brenneri]|uniref:CBN-CIT-1.2 protein n=1 Tax=Caenorhabditis brenneri TaxID=135651 RepID=G0N084_CAEBE|nr:CBN-CIT-1.2 protein [Caenorhabditis brenneri]